ncbi:MAG: amidohydrolase [Bacteroides sp.]|nr:amidohydrolase [Bacteroides sp.]
MKVTVLQTNIIWENKSTNLQKLQTSLIKLQGITDIVILPEMFSTGFTMNSHMLAESGGGETITTLKAYAAQYKIALAGSFIAIEQQYYFNRAFFITPEGEAYYYDKKHLFRMGDEINHFCAGNEKSIITYKGWNICLLVCYDLRFPVWARNKNNGYDLLIYVANWPASRKNVWNILLPARALENMCYVCGVNRVGTDANDLAYQGGSVIYSPQGEVLGAVADGEEGSATAELSLSSLQKLRIKFPVWKDADEFKLC